jgi:hypothetical protein
LDYGPFLVVASEGSFPGDEIAELLAGRGVEGELGPGTAPAGRGDRTFDHERGVGAGVGTAEFDAEEDGAGRGTRGLPMDIDAEAADLVRG